MKTRFTERCLDLLQILKASMLYFALVFGAGFALGTIRVLWLVPNLGTRLAELIEMPIMLVVTIVAARWVVRRLSLPPRPAIRLGMGFAALAFMIIQEFTVVLWLQGLTFSEYFGKRDPISGTAYILMLGLFAIMPLLVARR